MCMEAHTKQNIHFLSLHHVMRYALRVMSGLILHGIGLDASMQGACRIYTFFPFMARTFMILSQLHIYGVLLRLCHHCHATILTIRYALILTIGDVHV